MVIQKYWKEKPEPFFMLDLISEAFLTLVNGEQYNIEYIIKINPFQDSHECYT